MFNYKESLPKDFHPNSKVWIYQASRIFSMDEAFELEDLFTDFVQSWKSHGAAVKGYANLFFGRFVIMMADETQATVSGCSTDSSVRLIKEIEQRFKVDMFNRQNLAFFINDKIEVLPLAQLSYAIENNFINSETLYFNNLINSKESLENNWLCPLKESWLAKKLHLVKERANKENFCPLQP